MACTFYGYDDAEWFLTDFGWQKIIHDEPKIYRFFSFRLWIKL